MSKKDFELIARSFANSLADIKDFNIEADVVAEITEHIAVNLALALATTNPNFDRDRFLVACGVK